MNQDNIYALHGFLSDSSCFDGFQIHLKGVNLFDISGRSLQEFAKAFNQTITTTNNILLGYSMGGRLSLHTLIDAPEKWKAAVIISAHPGLKSDLEKTSRLKKDQAWLQRFLEEDFDSVLQDWNKQSLFSKSNFKHHAYSKDQYLKSLQTFSLGRQEDLREDIARLKMPILWIVGELDQKYVELSQAITLSHRKSKIWIAANSAHRVPWEVKKEFELEVKHFLREAL